MRNYAEELAYYYFRFNGFFLLNNYVTHPKDRPIPSHSDSDLLAVRIGKPLENVGINFDSPTEGVAPCEILEGFIKECIADGSLPNPILIGIICEVKAGANTELTSDNLAAQIKRFGFVSNLKEASYDIQHHGYYFKNNEYLIIRILASISGESRNGFMPLRIRQFLYYISTRFKELRVEKQGGWDKFDSPLIQFLLKSHSM